MRASTVRSRFLDRCGDSFGVDLSFKDICILAAVLNSTCRSKFGPYVRASLRGAVMGLLHLLHVEKSRRDEYEMWVLNAPSVGTLYRTVHRRVFLI